ncbi:MAG: hypothetical protein K2N06_02370 [Oscillospiraceae bacterium]|nr:hypothetical protein [Oscillospiraceae bacterium]
MATGKQIQRIYALGAQCGLLDRELGADDNLHLWVKQWSLKDHISELTEKQANFIIARLIDYKENVCPEKPAEIEPITSAQQSLCFRLMYELAQVSPSEIDVRERLRGLICKVTGKNIKADGDIFYKVTRDEGAQIIETLKRIIRSEGRSCLQERKKKRGEKNGTGAADTAEPP